MPDNKKLAKLKAKYEKQIAAYQNVDYSSLDVSHGFATDGVLGGFREVVTKIRYTFGLQFLLGILGGLLFSIAVVAGIYATKAVGDTEAQASRLWIRTMIMGMIIPGGVILMTFLGGTLFTRHCFATLPTMLGVTKKRILFKGMAAVLFGNFIGSLILGVIFVGTGAYKDNQFTTRLLEIANQNLFTVGDKIFPQFSATGDLNYSGIGGGIWVQTIFASLISGFLCGILASGTGVVTHADKNPLVGIVVTFFCVLYYVLSNYSHGPSNMFYFWSLLFMKWSHPETLTIFNELGPAVQNLSSGGGQLAPGMIEITDWSGVGLNFSMVFFACALLPSIVGNWIGGGIVMPGVYYVNNREYVQLLAGKMKLENSQEQLREIIAMTQGPVNQGLPTLESTNTLNEPKLNKDFESKFEVEEVFLKTKKPKKPKKSEK
ncbi:formate/nitrite transporter [Spiroplasma sabaudiense Ar-1343]|uniref:Formate/nitrite transporter n=1 Tax=Spiroplasma sabaudiense Ar-1343 TaxID=1276257 RepID=W6A8T3_9MOLU|nr:formate/nitrite transporter family protein [Spiroplasma sabaudiense]AHI53568.1 formate/nitrite transporter [Spiroplasma sabaudiense Ar-1343]